VLALDALLELVVHVERHLGLHRDDLIRDDNADCLELADLAHRLECDGLLVPSAAVVGETNVVIWRHAVPRVVRVMGWKIVTTHDRSTRTDVGPRRRRR
jgi:RES domain-containing protein